jgi:HEAT repeat protein
VDFVRRAHNMGIDPATAIPALKEFLNDEDPNIRREAAKALNLIVHTTAI